MIYPTGILKNTATGRFHPISFRPAPMPGGADSTMAAQRYKSLGHHTEGFATIDEAEAWIKTKVDGDSRTIDTGERWDWEGTDVPALVSFYNLEQLVRDNPAPTPIPQPRTPDITLQSHPDHHTVGKEFMGHAIRRGDMPAVRWFCESHDPEGYWLYATDGSNEWINVSERAIGRSFHEIYKDGHGLYCSGWKIPPYVSDLDLETQMVRTIGDRIGYGRMMQLGEKLWRESLGDLAGGEHSVGPCVALLVSCPHPGVEMAGHCDWCCGSGRITKRVFAAIEALSPRYG